MTLHTPIFRRIDEFVCGNESAKYGAIAECSTPGKFELNLLFFSSEYCVARNTDPLTAVSRRIDLERFDDLAID